MTKIFDAQPVLLGLKDFQRRTVDHVFSRLFDPVAAARRFLVADEVGLGKTLVAKGVIARTVEHLQRKKQAQVNVVYVCSNAGIATQNVTRLSLPEQPAFNQATRLTLLPLVTDQLREYPVNFISFTPGTTFNQTSSRGRKDERRLIYQMLREVPGVSWIGLRRAMRGGASAQTWPDEAEHALTYDLAIAEDYRRHVQRSPTLLSELQAISECHRDGRRSISDVDQARCRQLIVDLRRALAKVCLGALKPDLVILDEFQRFSELFDDPEDSPAAELAHALFNHSQDLRVLLLSATPYRMYAADNEEEDHYKDFLRTIDFLMPDARADVGVLAANLKEFRLGLLSVQGEEDLERLSVIKARIEASLRRVMCRTERVGTTRHADAMIQEQVMVPVLTSSDLRDYRWLEELSERLDEPDTLEYWKSSPYLLSFMKEYSHKHSLRKDQDRRRSLISDLIDRPGTALLASRSTECYDVIDAGNPRLRRLMNDMDAQGLWRLLWMPPSMPYWQPEGVFGGVGSVTKHLIFSAWNVVPDALASMMSYEIERRIVEHSGVECNFSSMPDKLSQQLRFSRQTEGRSGGMSTLMLMFPSRALVELADPLCAGIAAGVQTPTFDELRRHVAARLAPMLESMLDRSAQHGPVDRRWYWIALARIERQLAPTSRLWCEERWSDARLGADDEVHDLDSAFHALMEQWLLAWDGRIEGLGRVPPDVAEVLASLALSGPANCALRALTRRWPLTNPSATTLLSAASRIAEGLRSQFNSPRAVGLLKGLGDDDSYWERVLQYGADGNLQALLDEHLHVLLESKNLMSQAVEPGASSVAAAMFEAMVLRASPLRPDELSVQDGRLQIKPFENAIRTHFAVRYGGKSDDDGAAARKETVQAAFNSPFWPFVLVSTSVGQEGLDFHTWCHSVIHWNLPANPVDMEQREGRVHRYKGYAVRKNVAALYGDDDLGANAINAPDPWTRMFERARRARTPGSSELVPYWICERDGGACIERRVMLAPLSRDEARYHRLRRSLALYRMVFAQPRQEDLLACLERAIGADRAIEIAARWRIDLSPPLTNDDLLHSVDLLAFGAKAHAALAYPAATEPFDVEMALSGHISRRVQ